MANDRQYVSFNNVKLLWTNFEGEVGGQGKGRYNKYLSSRDENGNPIPCRTFNVVLTEEMADRMREMGAKIHTRPPRSDDEEALHYLPVSIGRIKPDTIWRSVPGNMVALNAETIGCLDHEYIDHADMKVTLLYWENERGNGWKAWCSKLIAYVNEDDFEKTLRKLRDANEHKYDTSSASFGLDEAPDDDDLPF